VSGKGSLEHFGIKGMKWGVRRKNPSSSPTSDDASKAKETLKIVKKHGTSAVSNKDLQDLVTRMNLEQNYARLTGTEKKKYFDGKKFTVDIIENIAKKQISSLGNEVATKQIANALGASKGRHRKK
jgi:hypothetical protein